MIRPVNHPVPYKVGFRLFLVGFVGWISESPDEKSFAGRRDQKADRPLEVSTRAALVLDESIQASAQSDWEAGGGGQALGNAEGNRRQGEPNRWGFQPGVQARRCFFFSSTG